MLNSKLTSIIQTKIKPKININSQILILTNFFGSVRFGFQNTKTANRTEPNLSVFSFYHP